MWRGNFDEGLGKTSGENKHQIFQSPKQYLFKSGKSSDCSSHLPFTIFPHGLSLPDTADTRQGIGRCSTQVWIGDVVPGNHGDVHLSCNKMRFFSSKNWTQLSKFTNHNNVGKYVAQTLTWLQICGIFQVGCIAKHQQLQGWASTYHIWKPRGPWDPIKKRFNVR